jgi:cyclophilin family peptidyl-prolyl cis-trans isomerase
MLTAFARLSYGLCTTLTHRGLSRNETPHQRRKRRKRMARGNTSLEQLEPRAMMAVDVLAPITAQSLTSGAAATKIDLVNHFDETTITGTVVQFDNNSTVSDTRFYVELFDKEGPGRTRTTPLTAANFLSYVDADAYDGSIIHRSVLDFVVQGGGYYAPTVPADQVGSNPVPITQGPTVANEPGNTNVWGTIAMAKLGGLPDSATSQWFFNMGDNSANLDNQNGGFTVFGRVLGDGMNAVGAMGEASIYNATNYYGDSALNELPLWNAPAENNNIVNPEDFLTFTSIARGSENIYTVQSSAPNIVAASTDGTNLVLTPGVFSGAATITVTATSVADSNASAQLSFNVVVTGGTPAPAPDAVMTFTSSGLWLLSQTDGTKMVTSTFAAWSPAINWGNLMVGDFNGDGLEDVVGQNLTNGVWYASLNQGDGTGSTRSMGIWAPKANWRDVTVGDYNGDGIDDFAGRASSGAWYAALGKADGTGFTNKFLTAWNPRAAWGTVRVGDFNGDGSHDIAGHLTNNGQWWVAFTATDGTVTNRLVGKWSPLVSWEDIMVGDFNGDENDDIVGRTGNSGAWYAALGSATSTSFTTQFLGSWSPTIDWRYVTVLDINGDGRSDLLGQINLPGNPSSGANGQWWAGQMQSNTLRFTNTLWGKWSQTDWQQVSFGDFNDDGRVDAVGQRPSTDATQPNQWTLGRNNGSILVNSAFGYYGQDAAGQAIGGIGDVVKTFTFAGPG